MYSTCRTPQCDAEKPQLVHYVIIRADLPAGSQGAQIIHAAGESAALAPPEQKPKPGCIAVALHARDEDHLLAIAARLDGAGVATHHVMEVDEPYSGQLMAIGIVPTFDRPAVRKVTSDLPRMK